MGRVDSLKILDLKFAEMLAGFPEFSEERNLNDRIQRNGTLGAEILRHFLVTFDYLHELLYLKRRSRYQRKTEHDMSGMEIYIDNETVAGKKQAVERYYVGRIEKGSPAELSGMQAGDQIRSIDFRSISTYSLNDLNELLKERDGKQLIIELQRKKEMVIVILRLKRRI
jgi:C-terminal processing protease CtpA/Prc